MLKSLGNYCRESTPGHPNIFLWFTWLPLPPPPFFFFSLLLLVSGYEEGSILKLFSGIIVLKELQEEFHLYCETIK